MKKFVVKLLFFFSPVVLLLLLVIYADIFKVFFSYDDYYKGNFVTLNREMICTETYKKHRVGEKFNSYIFGNSRSQAFKCAVWKNYLGSSAVPFHFDASGEGTYGVANKVRYIDKLGDTIKNALIILDRDLLTTNSNRESHLFISPPCLSNDSKFRYYTAFLKASLDFKFLRAYVDYSIFRTYRSYMKLLINDSKYPPDANNINCDLYYGYDKQIKADSLGYYRQLIERGVFYQRPYKRNSESHVTNAEIDQLSLVKEIFTRHHTTYKIVISPIYDQIPMEAEHLNLLYRLFGKENVYNFSGVNKLTAPISNYYESDHYRPQVANEILEMIYLGRKTN